MSDVSIFVVKPGALKPYDKAALRKAGVVVVEIDDPASFRVIKAETELSGSDMLLAAMRGLKAANSYSGDSAFRSAIGALVEAKHAEGPHT